jgi:hypothetical protein
MAGEVTTGYSGKRKGAGEVSVLWVSGAGQLGRVNKEWGAEWTRNEVRRGGVLCRPEYNGSERKKERVKRKE